MRFATRGVTTLAVEEQLYRSVELNLAVIGATMTAATEEYEIILVVGIPDCEVVGFSKHADGNDVVDFQTVLCPVVAAGLADLVALTDVLTRD